MFISNYPLKSFVQKFAMTARLPIGYAQNHPYTGLQARAHSDTLEFIMSEMPDAIAFDTPREMMGYALEKSRLRGLYAEFGVNSAGTTNFIASRKPDYIIHGFDSFEGLPDDWSGNQMAAGFFHRKGRLPKVTRNVRLHAGWFNESLPLFVAANSGPAAFLHIDCDLYSSTKTIFENFGDRIVPGTVMVFDEYFNYPNWRAHEHKAFEEFRAASGKRFEFLAYSVQQIAVIAV